MGASCDDLEAFENEPRSEQFVEAFYIAIHPVTQSQYRKLTQSNPAAFRLSPQANDCPMENVRATEAERFAELAGNGLRLPTEIEWEYACRAGSPSPRHGPIDEVAWHKGHPRGQVNGGPATVQAVAKLAANAWGLHDTLGNVWEWTSTRDESADGNVVRGGSFMSLSKSCRASARFTFTRSHASRDIGFRVAVGTAEVLAALESPR